MSYPAYKFDHENVMAKEKEGTMRNNQSDTHKPVLLEECIENLKIKPNGVYLDATFGRGGHTREILEKLDDNGILWVLDRDPEAIVEANGMAKNDSRIKVLSGRFTDIDDKIPEGVQLDGALFDLGISSPQIDKADRGFSFQQDGPLDMRMNNEQGMSAADWINRADKDEIVWVLENYGEEKKAQEIADKVIEVRNKKEIKMTKDLVEIILASIPNMQKGKHPATKSFQAIRMHINAELDEISDGLPQVLARLNKGSRLVIMSYHSLEHKIVSDVLKRTKGNERLFSSTSSLPRLRKIGNAIRSGRKELANNRRARSALLRTWEVVK
ncbi:MAG: 16S rRNA (cytosine(1402)-N(4))-methyltransferase RsmH [Pseudomonadota bacterium]|nr:16S rRNA (cytosine(1402)-N(4))-methyltransferase RsmH [Pseudomonadota bacterium]